jgi:hypothetical protein
VAFFGSEWASATFTGKGSSGGGQLMDVAVRGQLASNVSHARHLQEQLIQRIQQRDAIAKTIADGGTRHGRGAVLVVFSKAALAKANIDLAAANADIERMKRAVANLPQPLVLTYAARPTTV